MPDITLTPEQAAYLKANKMVAVVLPIPNVILTKEYGWVIEVAKNTDGRGGAIRLMSDWVAPFTPGDRVEVRDNRMTLKDHAIARTTYAIPLRTARVTVTTCEPIEIAKVTEEQAKRCGHSAHPLMSSSPQEDLYQDHPGEPWGWYVELKGGE